MKVRKWSAMMMVLALASAPAAVFAESEDDYEKAGDNSAAVEMRWEDEEEEVSDIEASFVDFDEIGLKLWVPDFLEAVELTEDEKENGMIGFFQSEDGSASVIVEYPDKDAEGGIEEYEAALKEGEDVISIQYYLINGIECLSYDLMDSDTSGLAVETEEGDVVNFLFSPMSDDESASIFLTMMCSIQTL